MTAALLSPRSIAVVGASPRAGSLSRQTMSGLQRHGFGGTVVAVNPSYDEIDGVPCLPTLKDVGGPVDLVLVFVAAERVPDVLSDAADAGAGAAVVFSSGFAEVGEDGAALQADVRRISTERSLRVLGPNCQGLCDFRSSLVATFTPAAFRDDLPPPSPVAYVGQSGAVGGSFFDLCRFRGITPLAWISTGNEVDLGAVEVSGALIGAGGIELLCLYLEQVPPGAAWRALLEQAASAGTTVAVLRSGRSQSGQRAASSHTGALVRPDRAFDLVCEEQGVIGVDSIGGLVDVAVGWRGGLRRGGRRLAVLTTSGGAGSLAADAAEDCGMAVGELQAETQNRLRSYVPDYGAVANPVDVTAQLMTVNPRDFGEVCRITGADPGVDQLLVVLTNVTGPTSEQVATALVELDAAVPVSVAYLAAPDATASARAILAGGGVAVFDSVGAALRAAQRLTAPGPAAARPLPVRPLDLSGLPRADVLTEWTGAALLDASGIRRPASVLVRTRAEAQTAAGELGDAVVLKVSSAQLLHKSDHGAVRVGVRPADAGDVFDEMLARVGHELPKAAIEGVIVQAMAPPGVELLVGVKGPEDGYPPVVTVGIGGTAVEVYADVASATAPLDDDGARRLLRRLRGFPLLAGHRGGASSDLEAAAAAVAALSQAASTLGPTLGELEINPLIVHPRGHGVTAVDLLVRLVPSVRYMNVH